MKYKTLLFAFLYITFNGNSQSSRQKVFDKYLKEISGNTKVTELRNNLRDSVKSWIDRELYYTLFLTKTTWEIDDAVFLNGEKNKALLLILVQPHDVLHGTDYVKIVAAECIEEKWKFYYAGYPISVFYRKGIRKTSLDTLSNLARLELINDGFVKCRPTCKINSEYVQSDVWFTDKKRKMHERFLSNTLPTHPLEKPGDSLY